MCVCDVAVVARRGDRPESLQRKVSQFSSHTRITNNWELKGLWHSYGHRAHSIKGPRCESGSDREKWKIEKGIWGKYFVGRKNTPILWATRASLSDEGDGAAALCIFRCLLCACQLKFWQQTDLKLFILFSWQRSTTHTHTPTTTTPSPNEKKKKKKLVRRIFCPVIWFSFLIKWMCVVGICDFAARCSVRLMAPLLTMHFMPLLQTSVRQNLYRLLDF